MTSAENVKHPNVTPGLQNVLQPSLSAVVQWSETEYEKRTIVSCKPLSCAGFYFLTSRGHQLFLAREVIAQSFVISWLDYCSSHLVGLGMCQVFAECSRVACLQP